MANGFFFAIQSFVCLFFLLGALRFGKSALISFISLQTVLANFFVMKQIELFGLTLTCSDLFMVSSLLGLNLLQEYYGRAVARKAVEISFFSLFFFAAISQIHLWYLPAPVDFSHDAFETLLKVTPRMALSSLFVYYIVQRVEISLFDWFKKRWSDRYLSWRVTFTLCLTQALDTLLFSFLALYGVVNALDHVIFVSYLMKLLLVLGGSFFVTFARHFLHQEVVEFEGG